MAELKDGILQNESDDAALVQLPLVEQVETDEIQNINVLPPEILEQILAHLPQREMVRNRSVCRYWRNAIDENCTMKVEIGSFDGDHVGDYIMIGGHNDKFIDRKLQLRIKECNIIGFDHDTRHEVNSNISFANPQCIRVLRLFLDKRHAVPVPHLISQVKPNVNVLEIQPQYFLPGFFGEECCLSQPYVFPQLRDMIVMRNKSTYGDLSASDNYEYDLSTLFSHHCPLLTTLDLRFYHDTMHKMDKMYQGVFNFLAIHRHTIKRLRIMIGMIEHDFDNYLKQQELMKMSQFELPTQVKSHLCNGQLQLEQLKVLLHPRYFPVWLPMIKTAKNLVDLRVKYHIGLRRVSVGPMGVAFHSIRQGIESNILILRELHLCYILPISQDGITRIPFDCAALGGAVNLTTLKLHRYKDVMVGDDDEDPGIINLGLLPLTCLKNLIIDSFICDSMELQILVDNAPLLEVLKMLWTEAPDSSPRYASTGVHGGIIQSFTQKPYKIYIEVSGINYSNQDQNEKLKAVKRLLREEYGTDTSEDEKHDDEFSHYFGPYYE